MSTQSTGYTPEEIVEFHEKGHHIGNPEKKLHATNNEHTEPTSASMLKREPVQSNNAHLDHAEEIKGKIA
jgi:hypothetical protein